MTAAESAPRELEQVAVFALQAVMRGDTEEAWQLVHQLNQDDRAALLGYVQNLWWACKLEALEPLP